MRHTYQFNEQKDKPNTFGFDAEGVIFDIVSYNRRNYSLLSEKSGIEDQTTKLCNVIGGLCDVLISKGLLTTDEFLTAIRAENIYEARERV